MKKYVFLTSSICYMGGAEEYINRKVDFLQSNEYEVYIFSSRRGEVLISNLKKFEEGIITTLGLPPYIYTKKFVDQMIKKLIYRINYSTNDEIYIESNATTLDMWAEILANAIKAEHVIIDLQENHNYPLYVQKFYLFKYRRDELYGINRSSIHKIFTLIPGDYEPRFIQAACNDVIEQVKCVFLDKIPKADFNICSIGRLDKTFVLSGCREVVRFAQKHQDKTINLILIGDGTNERKREIHEILKEGKNINLTVTGYLYPIPADLLSIMNCFFSSAGSARVSANAGLPTVTMSTDGEPLGIMYYTTVETLYKPENYQYIELSEYFEMILIGKYCEVNRPLYPRPSFNKEEEFKQELTFFGRHAKEYYDVFGEVDFTLKEKVYKILSFVLGGTLFEKVQYLLHKAKGGKDV